MSSGLVLSMKHASNLSFFNVNDAPFIFVTKDFNTTESGYLNFPNHHVVLLSPVCSEQDMNINAISLFVLNDLHSRTGKVNINCTGRVISIGDNLAPCEKRDIKAEDGSIFLPSIEGFREKSRDGMRSAILTESRMYLLVNLVKVSKYSSFLSSVNNECQVDPKEVDRYVNRSFNGFNQALGFLGIKNK